MMPFPEDWHDFLKDYSFDDSQEVYTNGSRLIPVFRVEQLIKHLLKAQEAVKPIRDINGVYYCGNCDTICVGYEVEFTNSIIKVENYCHKCGRKVKWDG
jgi:hypothetical protein